MRTVETDPSVRRALAGMFAVGFAASGFFDGIILHQILQWHHLLSSLKVGVLGSLAGQVMFDGLFHAVMYVVAALGLIMLYRTRGATRRANSNRLQAMFWTGFGTWHVVDAIVSHWVTGIHRIRMDVTHPLIWDLGWLFFFGVLPLIAARMIGRRPPNDVEPGRLFCSGAITLTILAGALNAFPLQASGGSTVTIVLRPDRTIVDLVQGIDQTGAKIIWSDPAGAVWVLRAEPSVSNAAALYRSGAMFVSSSLAGAACGTWFKTTI